MIKVLLIIPSYNEEKNVLSNYKKIMNYNKKSKVKYDLIVINDGSTDKTEKICIENNISYISLVHNLGIGGAVQTGYKYALKNNYDVAVQFDGDGQHDVNYVKNIIDPIINKECDMCIGSRFIDNESSNFISSFARRIGINIISFFIKLKSGKKVYDTTSGFRAVNKEINNGLSRAEKLFFKGMFNESLSEAIRSLNVVEPGIKDKLLDEYKEEYGIEE